MPQLAGGAHHPLSIGDVAERSRDLGSQRRYRRDVLRRVAFIRASQPTRIPSDLDGCIGCGCRSLKS